MATTRFHQKVNVKSLALARGYSMQCNFRFINSNTRTCFSILLNCNRKAGAFLCHSLQKNFITEILIRRHAVQKRIRRTKANEKPNEERRFADKRHDRQAEEMASRLCERLVRCERRIKSRHFHYGSLLRRKLRV